MFDLRIAFAFHLLHEIKNWSEFARCQKKLYEGGGCQRELEFVLKIWTIATCMSPYLWTSEHGILALDGIDGVGNLFLEVVHQNS